MIATYKSLIALLLFPTLLLADPNIAKWEADMKSFGWTHCQSLTTYADTYYDSGRVYYQIYDYTKDAKWNTCARRAAEIYRDSYVIPNNGAVAGWWNFSDGLVRDGSSRSMDALRLLSLNAAFADISSGWGATVASDPTYSREIAYSTLLWSNVRATALPEFSQIKLDADINAMNAHVIAWFVTKTSQPQPFMVGLTAEALIRAKGEAALPQIRIIADGLRSKWTGTDFPYLNGDGTTSAGTDLNQLISPLYAWLCARGQYDCAFADTVFNAGVNSAFLNNHKQFNQNYRWSFDFVKWRKPVMPTTTTTSTTVPPTRTYKIIGGTLKLQEVQ